MAQPRRRSVWPIRRPSMAPRRKGNAPLMIAILVATAGVIVLGTLTYIAMVNNAAEKQPGDPSAQAPSDIPNAATGLNRPVRDGRLAFTIAAIKCGIATVGDDVLNERAQGQFCQVSLTVKNLAGEAQKFFASNQYAYDATGQKYEIDPAGAIYLDEELSLSIEDIDPGSSIEGIILFDIPTDATIVKLELHDSLFSVGATVNP